jgi:hypothetical protein
LTPACGARGYTETVRELTTSDLRLADESEIDAMQHIASIARALADMSGVATAISSTQRLTSAEREALRRLLPSLAARYGLRSSVECDGPSVTVRLERYDR